MTIRIDKKAGLIRALELLARDIEAGIVVSCSLHYEPTHVARLSICYVTGHDFDPELPMLPGVSIVDSDGDDEPTATTKPL